MQRLLLILVFWLGSVGYAAEPVAITGPTGAVEPGDLVQLTITGLTLEEAKQAHVVYYPRDGVTFFPAATWDGKPVIFFKARQPGKYLVGIYPRSQKAKVETELVVTGTPPVPPDPPNPPDPPGPEPTVNPYQPAPRWRPIAEPVAKVPIVKADAIRLAALYSSLGRELAQLASVQSTGDLRAELIRRGQSLGLRGKYPAAAEAVDKCLGQALTMENVPLAKPEAALVLETLAWAAWEAGK